MSTLANESVLNYQSDNDPPIGLSDSDSDGFQTPPEELAEVSNGVEQGAELGTKLEEIVTSSKGTEQDILDNVEPQDTKVKPVTSKENKGINQLESTEEAIIDHDCPTTTVNQYKLFPLPNTRQDGDHGTSLSQDRYTATSLYEGYITMMQCQQLTNAERKYHTILGHTKEQLCKEGKENEEGNTTRQDDLLTGGHMSLVTNEVGGTRLIENEDPVGMVDTIDDGVTLEGDSYLALSLCDNYRLLMQVKTSEQAPCHSCIDMVGGKESLETTIVENCPVVGVAISEVGVATSGDQVDGAKEQSQDCPLSGKAPPTIVDSTLINELPSVTVYIPTLEDNMPAMSNETPTLNDDKPNDMPSFNNDTCSLNEDTPSLNNDTSTLNSDTPTLNDDTPSLNNDMPSFNNDTSSLNEDTPSLNNDTPTLNDDTPSLNNDTSSLNEDTPSLNNDTSTLNNDTSSLNEDTPTLNDDTPSLNDDTPSLNEDTPIPLHEQHLSANAHTETTSTVKDLEVGGGTFKDLGMNTEATPTSDLGTNTEATPTLADIAINTNNISSMDISTNTDAITTVDTEALATVECSDSSCNTDLTVFEILKQVHRNEKYLHLEQELKLRLIECNEEKSKRMVNDNLIAIFQSDIVSLQQRNVEESTNRIRMDGEIAELKVCGFGQCFIINQSVH